MNTHEGYKAIRTDIHKLCITVSMMNFCGDNCEECGLKKALEELEYYINKTEKGE